MSIFLGIEQGGTETRARVYFTHYKPDMLSDEELKGGVKVVNIPEPEMVFGKVGYLYVNPTTLETWYEYVDRPLTPDEELQNLKEQMLSQQVAINMILGV